MERNDDHPPAHGPAEGEPLDPSAVFNDNKLDRPLTPRERAVVLARVQALIEFWDISPEELAAAPRVAAAPEAPPVPQVKYRHPVSGDTWDGQGEHPQWLRHALLQEGFRVEELRPSYQEATVSLPTAATGDAPGASPA